MDYRNQATAYRLLAAQNPDLWETVFPSISQVEVNGLPKEFHDDDKERFYAVTVERRSNTEDLFAVKAWGQCYDRDLKPEYERLPSSRPDKFIKRYRFPFLEALQIAERVSKEVLNIRGKYADDWE